MLHPMQHVGSCSGEGPRKEGCLWPANCPGFLGLVVSTAPVVGAHYVRGTGLRVLYALFYLIFVSLAGRVTVFVFP